MKRNCQIWGILNVTPDSFSDGGQFLTLQAARSHAVRMISEGAAVIDIGGQSSRPAGGAYGAGASSISAAEETQRVIPVVKAVRELDVTISVDTTKAEVADAALRAGARIINDVSCAADPELLEAVARANAEYVLMHTRAHGEITAESSRYSDVVNDVLRELGQGVERCVNAGISPQSIWLDPGLGFAKTAEQSVRLAANLAAFVRTGHRVLVGSSRKAFIAAFALQADGEPPMPAQRMGGTAVTVMEAVVAGVNAVRVHDVAVMWQVIKMAQALENARGRIAPC